MSLPVVLRDEARAEFDGAFDYYEQQRAGRGVDFAARVQEVLDRIAADPQSHAAVLADVRKAVVARFPYCVYYRVEAARVEVIAVFHTSRDPSIWQARALKWCIRQVARLTSGNVTCLADGFFGGCPASTN